MSRIFITGALGTLGSRLTDELRKRGHEVFGCDLMHCSDPNIIRADISEYRQLQRVFDDIPNQIDYVYHLAAEFGRHNGEDYYEQLWKTNAIGTRNVLEVCNEYGANLIFASSSEIYGEGDYPVLFENLTKTAPLDHPNEYALSKWVNEVQIRNFARREYQPYVICRFFNAYGPGEKYHPYRSVVALFCYRALHRIPYQVYQNYYRTFMYIDDFIPTLANVCENFKNKKIYNIGGIDYRNVEELSELVQRHAHLDNYSIDRNLVELLPTDIHNIKSKKPDISKAIEDLGHNPTIRLEEGVPKTIQWIKETYLNE